MKKGFVSLVGAGPGDAGLLTRKGAKRLETAEVVVYDRLVSSEIMRMLPETAEKINVGKASSHHTVAQPEINRILLEKALEGKRVVRLKGGDPFVFGRGGEELELLCENGVEFEIVPGVTSAVAAFTYAGIPVTHRDFCSSVHFITGHARAGGELHIPFDALVRLNGTLVFLMGLSAVPALMKGLLEAGMEGNMPAAVVENGTRTNQRKVIGTVATLADLCKEHAVKSPAIIAVGKVCSLSEKFDWFSALPLFGLPVVVTRPAGSSGTLADRLAAMGADVMEVPCMETVPIPGALDGVMDRLDEYEWITFSSKNGVKLFFDELFDGNRDTRALKGSRIGAVGSQTAAELRKYGIKADFVPDIFDGAHLGSGICTKVKENRKVLVLDALRSAGGLEEELEKAGVCFDRVPLYDTQLLTPECDVLKERIRSGEEIWLMFTSASAVEGFSQIMRGTALSSCKSICIGEQTAAAAEKNGIPYMVSKEATINSMIDTILEAVK